MASSLSRKVVTASVLSALTLAVGSANAARVASDNAGNATYNSGWANGSNGGTGFGAWSLFGNTGAVGAGGYNPTFHGVFVGDSNTNGSNGGPGINTAGRSWGFYANTSNTQNNVRPFLNDSLGFNALTVGQTLRFRLDNGNINNPGSVGISLQTSSGANRFELFFGGGNSNYSLNDGVSSNVNTGLGFSDGGIDVAFTVTGANAYTVVVTRLAGGIPLTRSASLLGSPNALDIAQIRFFNFNAGNNAPANAYANSLSITKPISVISAAVPAGYGNLLGNLAVTGSNGSYNFTEVTGLNAEIGYVQASGFSPATDTQIYALRLVDTSGVPLSAGNLSALATAIGANASTINPQGAFPAGYNLFVTYTGLSPMPNRVGFDFSTAAQGVVTSGVRISAIALIPEPAALGVLAPAAMLLARRRRA